MCHLILLVPVFGLSFFYFLPLGEASLMYAVVLVPCALLYWLIWRSQCRPVTTGIEGMIGEVGRVFQRSESGAKVFYRGEIWEAICEENLSVGEPVVIVGLARMKLVVRHQA